jgi:hypothetical protein
MCLSYLKILSDTVGDRVATNYCGHTTKMPVRGPLDMTASHIDKRTYTSAMQMLGPYLLVEKKGSKSQQCAVVQRT